MANLKNYTLFLKLFVTFLTAILIISCSSKSFTTTKIEAKNIAISQKQDQNTDIENLIKPYREKINNDLDKTLCYNPQTLDKSKGKWQTDIGNLMADITLQKGNKVFNQREHKNIDICLLNLGGIRAILPKGPVTSRNAYEIMPFENSLVVLGLKGEQILDMVNFIIADKKAHPLSGLSFTIDQNNQPQNILVGGKALNKDTQYYVGTNDYLANGGDNMSFFQKKLEKYELDYKLRNIMIDYFKEVDTIKAPNDIRIFAQN